jgi:formylglycine-generating enzyme required for sulfatase activity
MKTIAVRFDIVSMLFLCVLWTSWPPEAAAVTIPTARVGDVGNANDPTTGNVLGGVNYVYQIATTEVTNSQYVAFLNAKAASDPLALYNSGMTSDIRGGIIRSGVDGSYSYAAKPNMGNKPVVFVNFYDAMRFANWMHNNQGSGDTETGAYTLTGGTVVPSNGTSVQRNVDAKWFVPTASEWYKAAYYQPAADGGDSDSYWLYPTGSNSAPTPATSDAAGNVTNPGANVATYLSGANWNGGPNVTSVAGAGPLSESYYGTSDQGGNAWEWSETRANSGHHRAWYGGAFNQDETALAATQVGSASPGIELNMLGFRLASVPEPSTVVLAAMGLVGLAGLAVRKRRGKSSEQA